jgi:hypothetical protein
MACGFLPLQSVAYMGRFPLVVIGHEMANQDAPSKGAAETKQISALAAIKAANGSCQTPCNILPGFSR